MLAPFVALDVKRLALIIATVAAGLWLGGIVHLLIAIQSLFSENRSLGSNAGPTLFGVFQWYGLGLGIVTAIAAWLGKAKAVGLLAIVGIVAAALLPIWIMPAMASAEAGSEAFKRLHGLSMIVYLVEFAGAAAATLLLAWRAGRP